MPSKPTGWAQAGDPLNFAHEGGHIFGCLHNREQHKGGSSDEARYGYLMEGSASMSNGRMTHGKRTIMAYFDSERVYTDAIARFSDNIKCLITQRVVNFSIFSL